MRVVAIKKAIIIIFVTIICISAIILWRTIPRSIDLEYKGLQYDMGTKNYEELKIKINGKLYKNDVFKGNIVIDNIDLTKKYDMIPITFDINIMNGMGTLVYTTVVDGEPVLQMVGTIRSIDDFSKVYINTNKSENRDQFIIAAPARNLEEFNNIKNEIEK